MLGWGAYNFCSQVLCRWALINGFKPLKLACEQALCLGKNSEEREGKGGERACRQTFEAAIPPSCNYPADHLSVRSLSVNQFRT